MAALKSNCICRRISPINWNLHGFISAGAALIIASLVITNAMADDNTDTVAIVQTLQAFLDNPRRASSKDGLDGIRYYNSGFGTRGDAHISYTKQSIPLSGIFAVSKRLLPISIHEMFGNWPEALTAFKTYNASNADHAYLRITGKASSLPNRSSQDTISALYDVLRPIEDCSPCIVLSGDVAIVANIIWPVDGGIFEGDLAILVREQHHFRVRAIAHTTN